MLKTSKIYITNNRSSFMRGRCWWLALWLSVTAAIHKGEPVKTLKFKKRNGLCVYTSARLMIENLITKDKLGENCGSSKQSFGTHVKEGRVWACDSDKQIRTPKRMKRCGWLVSETRAFTSVTSCACDYPPARDDVCSQETALIGWLVVHSMGSVARKRSSQSTVLCWQRFAVREGISR